MDDAVRQTLIELCDEYGFSLLKDPDRLEACLHDLAPARHAEIHCLTMAVREGVVGDLLNTSDGLPIEGVIVRLTDRLCERMAMNPAAARWAVEGLAMALGKAPAADVPREPAATASSPEEGAVGQPEVPRSDVPAAVTGGRPARAADAMPGAHTATRPPRRRRSTWLATAAALAMIAVAGTLGAVMSGRGQGGASSLPPASTSPSAKLATGDRLDVGDAYGGGIVAYVFQPGDPGYIDSETHGLIAAETDQGYPTQWAKERHWGTEVSGARGTALGDGAANTEAIVAKNGAGISYAAGLARAYDGGGYDDWYLPSKDELNVLFLNRGAIGGFADDWPVYWSSSQYADIADQAWARSFTGSYQFFDFKCNSARVRAIRSF